MKKILLCLFMTFGWELSAACPPGYLEIDAGALWVVAKENCPSGYLEVSGRLLLPAGGVCDTAKGTCSNAGVCAVP